MAHLVLPDTQADPSQNQKSRFLPQTDKNDNFEYEIFIKRQLNKMQGKQLRKLEAELWRAADQLRANSKLTASEWV
jgi:hypothetical protein